MWSKCRMKRRVKESDSHFEREKFIFYIKVYPYRRLSGGDAQ